MEYDTNRLKPFKPSSEREANIARVLADRYHIIKRLGEGGSGAIVFAVYNKLLDRVEALKVLSDDLTCESDFIDRFRTEARISASLAHPNIVTIYEYQNLDNLYFFTMLYINGPPLTNFTKGSESMPARRVCTTIATVCDAIGYAHQQGVIHRDLKVSNIILDQLGNPYVTDFGIAKWERSLTLTHTGQILGSPHYISPEQATGLEIDARSDIYALGVTLYVLLTHHYPFQGDSPHLTIAQRLYQSPAPPQSHNPDLHPRLIAIVNKALQKKRRDRYQTAAELARDLNDFVRSGASAVDPGIRRAQHRNKFFELFKPNRLLKLSKMWRLAIVAVVVLIAGLSLFFVLKPTSPAVRTAMKQAPSRQPARPAIPDHKDISETKSLTAPSVLNDQHEGFAPQSEARTATEPPVNPPAVGYPNPEPGLNADPGPEPENTTPAVEQQPENPEPSPISNTASDETVPTPDDDAAASEAPPVKPDNKVAESPGRQDTGRHRFVKELTTLTNDLKKAYLSGRYEICLKIANTALDKIKSLPSAQKAEYSDRRIEIKRFKTLAAQKLSSQKYEQNLKQLAAKTRRHFQNGDYASCMYTASAIISKIESLDAGQQTPYAQLKKEAIGYQAKAAKANQIRQRQLAVLEKIKKSIAEGNLEVATSLVNAMLVQEANLSPEIHDTLLAYRKKIKTRLK